MVDVDASKKQTTVDGIDPNAFDGQMLLMDAFMGNIPGISTVGGAKYFSSDKVAKAIPYLENGFDSVNALTGLSDESGDVNNFISNLTPHEYAQMYPMIRFYVVSNLGSLQKQVLLPISVNSDYSIKDNLSSQGYFYGTREMGLKSLSLSLDGSDLPFFGKSYIVTADFVFDSINTFMSTAPNLPYTYSQIFRSSGRVGEEQFYTRLSIGYGSTNTDIVDKYSLDSSPMKFSMMLTLIKSSIKIEENLKVTVSVTYQSRPESVFNSNMSFDFLGLDLVEAEKETRDEINSANAAMKAYNEAEEQFISDIQEKVKQSDRYKRLEENSKTAEEALQSYDFDGDEDADEDGVATFGRTLEENAKKAKKALSDAQEEFSEKKLKKIFAKETRINVNNRRTTIKKQIENRKKKALKGLANLRHTQLTQAIDETFSFAGTGKGADNLISSGVLKTIYLSSKQLENYYKAGTAPSVDQKKKLNNVEDSQRLVSSFVRGTPPAAESTVTVKTRTDKKKSGEISTRKYDQQTDDLLRSLGEQKQIDYILFGDLLRMVYDRLYTLRRRNAGKALPSKFNKKSIKKFLSTVVKSSSNVDVLDKCILLFSEIELEKLDNPNSGGAGGRMILQAKNLYDLPISTQHLKYILARKLYGSQQNMFTLFQLVDELLNLVILTRKRKNQVLNSQVDVGNFSLKKITYPLESLGNGRYKINTDTDRVPADKVNNGMLIYVKRVRDNKPVNKAGITIPTFVFGGPQKGIIKKFQISEITDDDIQKMVMEQIKNNSSDIIPAFFEVGIDTIMAPFFQLGMQIKVIAPSINEQASSVGGLFLTGDYQISEIKHEFDSSSGFNSSIKGVLYSNDREGELRARGYLTASDERKAQAEKEAAKYKDLISSTGVSNKIDTISDKLSNKLPKTEEELAAEARERIKNRKFADGSRVDEQGRIVGGRKY